MRLLTMVLLGIFWAAGCREAPQRTVSVVKEIIRPAGMVQSPVFSTAVRTGNLLFLSGQIGVKPGTRELVPGGVEAETRQTLENIKSVLEAGGLSMEDLVKCGVFLADIRDYDKVNEVYATYFLLDPPAGSAVAGSGLALGARVEVECIATVY